VRNKLHRRRSCGRWESRDLTTSPVIDLEPINSFSNSNKKLPNQHLLGIVKFEDQNFLFFFIADGDKIKAAAFSELLFHYMVHKVQKAYSELSYVLQHDSGPAHATITTQKFLRVDTPLKWSSELSPPVMPPPFTLEFQN
jgi:hypothetical protein